MFRVIIAGGRDFKNYNLLEEKCDRLLSQREKDDIVIISGGAIGVDTLGLKYADKRGYKTRVFIPNWHEHGKSAGFIRNTEMSENADALIAFWDNKSHGTKHMIDTAKKKGLIVRVINY